MRGDQITSRNFIERTKIRQLGKSTLSVGDIAGTRYQQGRCRGLRYRDNDDDDNDNDDDDLIERASTRYFQDDNSYFSRMLRVTSAFPPRTRSRVGFRRCSSNLPSFYPTFDYLHFVNARSRTRYSVDEATVRNMNYISCSPSARAIGDTRAESTCLSCRSIWQS